MRGRGSGTGGTFLTIRFDSQTPLFRMGNTWLWSNSIDATPKRVEGMDRNDWIRSLALRLAGEPDFLWGAAYLSTEFHASNIDTRGGQKAIGRNARRHLTGLYWLNLFGSTYTALMDVASARSG